MGGKGSGGARVGAGRRRKSQAEGALTGSRRTRARAKDANQTAAANQTANQNEPVAAAATAVGPEPATDVQIPQPPGSLTLDELAEWNDLAPRAAKQATLTDDTLWALADLCRDRVLHTRLTRDIGKMGNVVIGAGGNYAANPLLARYTTLRQRIEAQMLRFRLSPMGKEMAEPSEKPVDPFSEFDQGAKTVDGETRH